MTHIVNRVGQDDQETVYFYERDFYCLSNFSAFEIEYLGVTYKTAEHAYQCSKFYGGSDSRQRIQRKIIDAKSAHAAYKVAHHPDHEGWEIPDWDELKLRVMEHIIRAKFDQHEYVRQKLRATGQRTIVEDSWRDDFWGRGPTGEGKNHLGLLWMDLRSKVIVP